MQIRSSVIRRTLLLIALAALLLGATTPNLASAAPRGGDPGQPGTLDALFLDVARQAPSFGGMFLDEAGVLNVYLLDPTRKAATARAIENVFGSRLVSAQIRVLQARYGFAQLSQWHDRFGSLFNISGVVLTDIDDGANELKVGVSDEQSVPLVERELSRLRVPRAAVNIVITDPIVPVATLREKIRPIQGGIQIAFSLYLCTLGFNGVRSAVEGFVVNSHCTDKQGGVEDTKHYQPSVGADNFIGTEIADPLYTQEKCPPGVRGKKCRWSDSAYSQRDSAVTADLGSIAKPDGVNNGSLNIAGTFEIISEGASIKGDVVNKVGRTTGWSQGKVTDVCVNVSVRGSNVMQLCQDIVSASVGGGDSGSPTFWIGIGDNVQLRGILWGGNRPGTVFVYSPIANVERTDELGPITTCASLVC